MSSSDDASYTVQESIAISGYSDEGESSKNTAATSVADNEHILHNVNFGIEVEEDDMTSHPATAQPAESYVGPIMPPMKGEMRKRSLGLRGSAESAKNPEASPKKPYRALLMRACNDYGVLKENRKKRAKKSSRAAPKRKKSAP